MKRLTSAIVGLVALLLATAAPVSAITYGQLDDGEHPYVGFMIFYDPNEPGWFSCSGTLLDARTFLTAGHCTFGIGIDRAIDPDMTGGTDVWVTFDDSEVLAGWPARTAYPDQESLYNARRAWLESHGFIQGTSYPSPAYDGFAEFPDNHDFGVVKLDADAPVTSFGQLAPLGTVEKLVKDAPGPNDALVETVGYGIQSIQPKPMDVETRYKSTSRIVEVNGKASTSGNLHTLNNPSAIGGRGGSCFGDSGGPVMVPDTNQVVAVVSYGFSATCHGADYSWRVDTSEVRDFLASLPD